MFKSRKLVCLIGLPLIALLVACGGDDDGNGNPFSNPSGSGDSAGTPAGSGNAPAATSGAGPSNSGGNVVGTNIQNACQLMSREEAAAALGTEVGEAQSGGEGPRDVDTGLTLLFSACRYSATASRYSISIGFERFGGAAIGQFRPVMRQKFEVSCPQNLRISGIGDVACWGDSRHLTLRFLKDTTSVVVEITGQPVSGGPDWTEPLRAVAQRADSRYQ